MTAKDYCIEIQKLLTEVGELNWAKCFENFISELELSKDNSAYRKIISIYGGMGSFDDLILYKDGVLCQKENDTLHTLKKELYKKMTSWKESVYNPSDSDIKKPGKFIETERYFEPGNYDHFSHNDYLKDK
ncbi:DUF6966 domain-containing protein [Flavobacterium inviolabile]|uniref:DUF6966 domain-containing protein n=1 Tax=Flavobacterium inviolabile TaxID=2748320 RepID=UPI0015AF5163|nr:hypothetical protein [Flavobacterium inviolabile]